IDAMNFEEAKVPPYDLPAALRMQSGEPVATAEEWRTKRRPEVMRLFRQHVYGQPLPVVSPTARLREEGEAYGGRALRRQVEIGFPGSGRTIDLVIYLPKAATGPVPCFLGLGFFGNEGNFDDPEVLLCRSWQVPSAPGREPQMASEAN